MTRSVKRCSPRFLEFSAFLDLLLCRFFLEPALEDAASGSL